MTDETTYYPGARRHKNDDCMNLMIRIFKKFHLIILSCHPKAKILSTEVLAASKINFNKPGFPN